MFNPGDVGPLWMMPAECKETRKRRVSNDTKHRVRTIAELLADLTPAGVTLPKNLKLPQLQEQIAAKNNVPTEVVENKTIKGWENEPKGLLQVLWERGWIDETKLEWYTMNGPVDEDGNVDEYFG